MPDTFGLLQIPVQVPAAGEAAGDPLLTKLLAYFKAVLNAHAQACWNTVGANQPLVRTALPYAPEIGVFADRELPALYAFRERFAGERLADGVEVDRSRLIVLWVPEPVQRENEIARLPFVNGVYKVLKSAVYNERDAAWVDAGDTDPDAATFGSWLLGRAALAQLRIIGAQRATLVVPLTDGAPLEYEALRIELEALECLEPSLPGLAAPVAEPAALSLDATAGAATVEFDDPTIPPP